MTRIWRIIADKAATKDLTGFQNLSGLRVFIACHFICFLLLTIAASAHEIRPAFLQITQTSETQYDVLWKVPVKNGAALKIQPQFSEGFELAQTTPFVSIEAALYRTELSGGKLEGTQIHIEGLEKMKTDVLLRIQMLDGRNFTQLLRPEQPFMTVPEKQSAFSVAKTYLILGVEHILFGPDHLLFVLALLFITIGTWKLIKTITAFTLAHSITLTLATLGYVNFPSAPVEAVIALSIVYLALEMVRLQQGRKTMTAEKPWLVALTFGLLHGLGFAGALADVGLPQTSIPLVLLFFNVGVEAGQLLFIAAFLLLRWLLEKWISDYPIWLKKVPAYAIGSIAAFWLIERVVGFW